ncbi:hypothetical protein [Ruminococcus sp.]|uniref:hypothetical protein n=1 Tax=Ruminococcus sp. TaxID=41978 RepID=UPI0025FC04BF|nr:hypothetical protein [Ruminococcus sp.]
MMKIENANYIKAVVGGHEYALQNDPKNVAAAIFRANAAQESISILTPDNVTVVSTFGSFIDRCSDFEYANFKLLPELTAMQTLEQPVPQVRMYRSSDKSKNNNLTR